MANPFGFKSKKEVPLEHVPPFTERNRRKLSRMSQAKLQPVQSIGSIEIELQLDLIDIIMSNLFVQNIE